MIEFRYRGREISREDILYIRALIERHPQESRRTLSTKLCEAWQWRQANGALRGDLCSGRLVRRCFLYTERKGETHRCGEEREGSHNRHSERGRFLRRRLPYRAASPPVLRNRNDRLLCDANRQELHDGSASPGTRVFRYVRGIFADTEPPIRRGFG